MWFPCWNTTICISIQMTATRVLRHVRTERLHNLFICDLLCEAQRSFCLAGIAHHWRQSSSASPDARTMCGLSQKAWTHMSCIPTGCQIPWSPRIR